ncbi:MAG: PsbP-related protein [Candidatus Nitrosocosmicus sp.]
MFIVGYFNCDAYSQIPATKIKQEIPNVNLVDYKWSNYTDNKDNFTIIYPKEWQIIKNKSNENNQIKYITIFRSPKENSTDIFQENIVISIIKSNINLSNSSSSSSFDIQSIIKKLEANNKEFKLDNISIIGIGNNQSGKSIRYSFTNSGLHFTTEQIFSILKDKIYIFSLLTEQKTFENYVPILNTMLKYFIIK